MKKILYPAGILTTALTAFVAFAAPAQADVHNANYGDRGRAWTNTAHTRVGVQDNRSDRITIWVFGCTVGPTCFEAWDDNDAGHTAFGTPDGKEVNWFQVCGWHVDQQRWHGCGDVVNVPN